MDFSSTIFLFLFLPIVLSLSLIVPKKYSNYFLLTASLVFYLMNTFIVAEAIRRGAKKM